MKPERELSAGALYWRARKIEQKIAQHRAYGESLKNWANRERDWLRTLARNRSKMGKSPPCNTGPSNASQILLS
jgi:HPt (histidine-containing phosphotransfer) domain-containing protein